MRHLRKNANGHLVKTPGGRLALSCIECEGCDTPSSLATITISGSCPGSPGDCDGAAGVYSFDTLIEGGFSNPCGLLFGDNLRTWQYTKGDAWTLLLTCKPPQPGDGWLICLSVDSTLKFAAGPLALTVIRCSEGDLVTAGGINIPGGPGAPFAFCEGCTARLTIA